MSQPSVPFCRALTLLACAFTLCTAAEELVFSDDFSKPDFDKKWVSGATCEDNTIKVVDGRVQATLNCNFIQTKEEFSGDLRVEVDVEKVGGQFHGCWDFFVELTGANGAAGVIRFDYNMIDGIAAGEAPETCGDQIHRPASAPNKGRAILHYSAPYLHFTFINADGKVLSTASTFTGGFEKSAVRIWLAAQKETPRYVDNVKVYRVTQGKK